jgi:hypothetical protein
MLLPLQCGGGPDDPTRVYLVLRSAVGQGGSAVDDSGIDGLWRRSRALGLSAATSATRRAFCNAWPFLSTDLLPHYERTLGIVLDSGASEDERRKAVAAMWPAKSSAVCLDVENELKRIDPRFTFELVPEILTTTSWDGRWFGSIEGGEAPVFVAGGNNYSELAGPTTRYMATAFLPVDDPGLLTKQDERSFQLGTMRLRAMLPSWEGFEVSLSVPSDGFLLDWSLMDVTALGDDT